MLQELVFDCRDVAVLAVSADLLVDLGVAREDLSVHEALRQSEGFYF